MKLEGKCTRPEITKFSWAENQVRWFKSTEALAPPFPTHTEKGGGAEYIVVSPNGTIIKWTFYYLHNLIYPCIPRSKLTHENYWKLSKTVMW
jgi:hypothetical protein